MLCLGVLFYVNLTLLQSAYLLNIKACCSTSLLLDADFHFSIKYFKFLFAPGGVLLILMSYLLRVQYSTIVQTARSLY